MQQRYDACSSYSESGAALGCPSYQMAFRSPRRPKGTNNLGIHSLDFSTFLSHQISTNHQRASSTFFLQQINTGHHSQQNRVN